MTVIRYKSRRAKAWRNVLVAAINAGLEQKLFGLKPGENWWPGVCDYHDQVRRNPGVEYHFEIDGYPGIGHCNDAGHDELSIYAALWPTGERTVGAWPLSLETGECVAHCWLERRTGVWIESSRGSVSSASFRCRKDKLLRMSMLKVRPTGYADRGKFFL